MLPTAVKSLRTSKSNPWAALWHAHGLTHLLVAVHALALPIITGAIIAVIKIARLHQLSFPELISQASLNWFQTLVNNFTRQLYNFLIHVDRHDPAGSGESQLLPNVSLSFQIEQDFLSRLVRSHICRIDLHFRIFRRFIGIINPREIWDQPGTGSSI